MSQNNGTDHSAFTDPDDGPLSPNDKSGLIVSRRNAIIGFGTAFAATLVATVTHECSKGHAQAKKTSPLVEPHLHSDCAHSPESLFKRARDIYGVKTVQDLAKIVQAPEGSDWDTWYKHFLNVRRAYTSPEMIGDLTCDTIEDKSKQGIDLLELRVSILSAADVLLKNQGVTDPSPQQFWHAARQIMDSIIGVIGRKNNKLKMDTDLVVSISAQTKYQKYIADLMRLCLDYRQHIIGLDITHEKDTSPSAYRVAIDSVRHEIKGLTVHCMEVMGPERGWDALKLQPNRIGHGLRAVEDYKLLDELAKRRIALEMCIHSNLVTGVVRKLSDHPMRKLHNAGIPLIIGSDGTNDNNTLADNYALARQLGFSEKELAQFRKNGWGYAFRNLGKKSSFGEPSGLFGYG